MNGDETEGKHFRGNDKLNIQNENKGETENIRREERQVENYK